MLFTLFFTTLTTKSGVDLLYMSIAFKISSGRQKGEDGSARNIASYFCFSILMFHFHHSMDMAPMVMKLEPGENKEIINKNHPRLLRIG